MLCCGSSAVMRQSSKRRHDLGTTIWLCHELAPGRQIARPHSHEAGRGEYLDGWPPVPDEAGELQPIHRTRHLDIGEDDVDIGTGLEDRDGLVGVAGLNDFEACCSIMSAASSRSRYSSSTIRITGTRCAI